MGGFCPDDFHSTTMDDIYQQSMGEDYDFWSDFVRPSRRALPARQSPEPLVACPFCDTSDAFVERADLSSCYVVCNNCGARGPSSVDETEADARATKVGGVEPGEMPARRLWNRTALAAARTPPVDDKRGEAL